MLKKTGNIEYGVLPVIYVNTPTSIYKKEIGEFNSVYSPLLWIAS